MQFAHITPTPHLVDFAKDRSFHLTLAHLAEIDPQYVGFYAGEAAKKKSKPLQILDNSAFEMYKQHRAMFDSAKLLEIGQAIKADYIVMTDYPGKKSKATIEAAERLGPVFKQAGFGTFFVPQSEIGNMTDYLDCVMYALNSPLVDYIGISILGVPNAYGVEKDNRLQRYLSRYTFLNAWNARCVEEYGLTVNQLKAKNNKKIHFLGMVDGPNEIELVSNVVDVSIDTWDSSAAVWAGLHDIVFDRSPTGLIMGKYEKEVDFRAYMPHQREKDLAKRNIRYIDGLVSAYNDRHQIQA